MFNAHLYEGEGGAFGIGSDSNVRIGVTEELRQLEYAQRLAKRMRNVLAPAGGSTGRTLLDAAALGGAQALARDCGRIGPGAVADLVALDAEHPTLVGKAGDSILDAWIFSAGNEAVDCVWSNGQKLVTGGKHAHRDRISARYKAAMARLAAA